MKSLASSAERRIRDLKSELLVSLHLRRGTFWDAVEEIRARWRIKAVIQLPHPIGPTVYLPPDHPEFARPDDARYEEWIAYIRSWRDELHGLHDRAIPVEGRVAGDLQSPMIWEKFLSACIVYDPPVPGLREFRDMFEFGLVGGPDLPDGRAGPDYYMHTPPLVSVRDAEKAERAQEEFYHRFIESMYEMFIKPQGLDLDEVFDRVLHNTPGLWDGLQEAISLSTPRHLIDPKPYHTEEDVRSAARMLSAAHTERPAVGRSRRDPLEAAECAILKDHHKWSNRQLAERYGWNTEKLATEYANTGRKVLGETPQN